MRVQERRPAIHTPRVRRAVVQRAWCGRLRCRARCHDCLTQHVPLADAQRRTTPPHAGTGLCEVCQQPAWTLPAGLAQHVPAGALHVENNADAAEPRDESREPCWEDNRVRHVVFGSACSVLVILAVLGGPTLLRK